MNSRLSGSTIVLGMVLVLAAACGQKKEEQAVATKEAPPAAGVVPVSTPGLDPCSLLTAADVQDATGKASEGGKPNTTNPTVCDYAVGDGGILNVVWKKVGPSDGPDATMAALKKANMQFTEQAGIGDRSFYTAPGYGMTQLNTFKGSNYVIITMMIQGAGEAQQKTVAEKLMGKALGKV